MENKSQFHVILSFVAEDLRRETELRQDNREYDPFLDETIKKLLSKLGWTTEEFMTELKNRSSNSFEMFVESFFQDE